MIKAKQEKKKDEHINPLKCLIGLKAFKHLSCAFDKSKKLLSLVIRTCIHVFEFNS